MILLVLPLLQCRPNFPNPGPEQCASGESLTLPHLPELLSPANFQTPAVARSWRLSAEMNEGRKTPVSPNRLPALVTTRAPAARSWQQAVAEVLRRRASAAAAWTRAFPVLCPPGPAQPSPLKSGGRAVQTASSVPRQRPPVALPAHPEERMA